MLSSEGGHFPGAREQNQNSSSILGEWYTPDPLLLSKGREERIDNQLQAKFLLKDLFGLHINTLVMEGTQRETEEGFPVGFRSRVLTCAGHRPAMLPTRDVVVTVTPRQRCKDQPHSAEVRARLSSDKRQNPHSCASPCLMPELLPHGAWASPWFGPMSSEPVFRHRGCLLSIGSVLCYLRVMMRMESKRGQGPIR